MNVTSFFYGNLRKKNLETMLHSLNRWLHRFVINMFFVLRSMESDREREKAGNKKK